MLQFAILPDGAIDLFPTLGSGCRLGRLLGGTVLAGSQYRQLLHTVNISRLRRQSCQHPGSGQ